MSTIFLTRWHEKQYHEREMAAMSEKLKMGINRMGEKPSNPIVGDTWLDLDSNLLYVWSEVDHNALDDIVAALDDREPKRHDWLKVSDLTLNYGPISFIHDEISVTPWLGKLA